MFRSPLNSSLWKLINTPAALSRPVSYLVVDLDRLAVVRGGFIDRETRGHRLVGVIDGGMRLDVVLNAIQKMLDLRDEGMVRHVAGVRFHGRESPVVERARVVLPGEDTVVLDGAVCAEQPHVEDVRGFSLDHR